MAPQAEQWIASSLALLAMTFTRITGLPDVDASAMIEL
jgi:hypothetical protein